MDVSWSNMSENSITVRFICQLTLKYTRGISVSISCVLLILVHPSLPGFCRTKIANHAVAPKKYTLLTLLIHTPLMLTSHKATLRKWNRASPPLRVLSLQGNGWGHSQSSLWHHYLGSGLSCIWGKLIMFNVSKRVVLLVWNQMIISLENCFCRCYYHWRKKVMTSLI